jgi:hypothetical protein
MVHISILQVTNKFIYPVSKWIAPSRIVDWPALIFIFGSIFILTEIRSLIVVGHALGFLRVTLAVFIESLNRFCVIYICSGLLSYSSLLINSMSNKALLDLTYELTHWQLKKVSGLMRQLPFLRLHFLKWAFWVWLLGMLIINIFLEHTLFNLVYA